MSEIYNQCLASANYIKNIIDAEGAIGIVLGSGLGELANEIENPTIINYADIPNFPTTTVAGHDGKLIFGTINQTKVLCMKGRFHYYEGHTMNTVVLPVRVMKVLGIKALILTNAAGGVNRTFKPGTLMLIDDFINFMGDNPLVGQNIDEFGPRFPDMTYAINKDYSMVAKEVASDLGIDLRNGVYMGFKGPNYESPAEIHMAEVVGASAVGMSTVPEIIAARHCDLPVIGISCITNLAAGITGEALSHEEVQEAADMVKEDFKKLVKAIVNRIG
ncbi:MAG: purine-nucleoside phosphorylase [Solobacterium sp.]|nr:purine-nucleoside phosphorylase [Solobacterium sp.]